MIADYLIADCGLRIADFGKASVSRITLKTKVFVLFLKSSVFMELLYDAKKQCSIENADYLRERAVLIEATADCGLRIADYLRECAGLIEDTADCGLRIADYLWECAVLIEDTADCGLRIADFGKASVSRITLKAKVFVLFLKSSVFMELLYDAKKQCSIGNADYLRERAVLIEAATMEGFIDCGLRIADFGKASVSRITLKTKVFVLFLKSSVFMELLYDAKKQCSIENRKSKIENRKSKIENRKSKIENRKSKINNQ